MFNKIILGTVQFGSKYGLNNKYGKINTIERKKIFNLCKRKKILSFDTAVSYKNSEDIVLNNFSKTKIKIYTKVNKKNFKEFLKDIKKYDSKIECIYFHKFSEYLDRNFRRKIFEIKKKYRIKKIGVSIYSSDDYQKIENDIDIVQLPLNILDRYFLENNFIQKLKKRKKEVHIRSVFLRGLLAIKLDLIKKKYPKITEHFKILSAYTNYYNLKPGELSLVWANSLKYVDKIVIGIDNVQQLKKNLQLLNTKKPKNFKSLLQILKKQKKINFNLSKWK